MNITKKRFSKILSFMLCAIMLMQIAVIGGFDISVNAADEGPDVTVSETFDKSFDELKATELWAVESWQKQDATAPDITGGVMKMDTKDSVQFNWTKVAGVGEYNSEKEYVFEFDMKVTNAGNGYTWDNGSHTRTLYIAFGGWFNQIEMNMSNGKIRVGDSYELAYSDADYLNKTVRAKLVLCGNKVTSTLYDAEGNELNSHFRSNVSFTDMESNNAAMTYLVLRCEDGAIDIDNFKFTKQDPAMPEVENSTLLEIPADKQAVYTCNFEYKADTQNIITINGKEALSLSAKGLKLCGSQTLGTYVTGKYGVKIVINKEQEFMYLELTLPDGGTIRRGFYVFASSKDSKYTVDFASSEKGVQSDIKTAYEAITVNKYELTDTEPAPLSDFEKNVYNLITSFDDASTTRNFAWTTKQKFATKVTMIFRYREAGATEWIPVQVTKVDEEVMQEDYYKVSLSGLKPDTSYEYQLAKKGQVEAKNTYGMIYTFKTAKENINSFEFVAIGDTQSVTWHGDKPVDKGYKYSMAAIKAAIQEASGRPAFILNAGDVTDRGDELSHWNWYFKSLGNYGQTIPHFATVGNHDTLTYDKNNYFGLHFNHPDNGKDAIDKSCLTSITTNHGKVQVEKPEETVYSYNYGGAHFIVLNSGIYGADDEHILKAQREWLTKDLEANKDAKWTVIMVHEAVYHRVGGAESRPWLNDVIESYGVDLVIQGHSHLVTRTYPMKDGKIVTKTSPDVIQKGTGTVYTTIGSTTLNHDGLGDPNVEECMVAITPDNNQPAYTVVKVTDNNLTMTIKQLNGAVLDEFVITTGTQDAPEQELPAEPEPTPKPPEQASGTQTTTGTQATTGATQEPGTNTGKVGCGSTIASGAIMLTSALGLGIGLTRKKKRK